MGVENFRQPEGAVGLLPSFDQRDEESREGRATAVQGVAASLADGARVVLIAGGEGKGADFSPLAVLEELRHVVLIGRDAPLLEAAFAGVTSQRAASMAAGVQAARAVARKGDVVLLAPACASFDMFDNFEARGRAFAQAVLEMCDLAARLG